MKKVLATILALVMALSLCSVSWATDPAVAKVGDKEYATLEEAVKNVQDDGTVVLLRNAAGGGIGTYETPKANQIAAKAFTINFNSFTYTLTTPAVGSAGYESQGFHLEAKAGESTKVVFMNGTINIAENCEGNMTMVIQNYCDLTLDNMVVDGRNLKDAFYKQSDGSLKQGPNYTLSNNSKNAAKTAIKDTEIVARITGNFANVAFDSDKTSEVSVEGSSVITGNIEVSATAKLAVFSGIFTTDVTSYIKTDSPRATVKDKNGETVYAVGASNIAEAATAGSTVEITYGENVELTGIPTGVTVKNSTEKDISINGNTIAVGKTETAKPTPTPSTGGYYYYPSTPGITAELNGTNKSATDYPGGDYGLVFRSTAAFSTFQGVQVDGKTLAKSNYTAEEGSTVVYLKAAYLKTLAAGKHTITILSTAGNTSMDFTIGGKSSSPQTFDAGVGIYTVTAVLSVTGMAWTAKKRH